ncbi:TPA: hypothetical protein ACG3KM_003524 [Clostridioides difficile]|uniref:hypothetical protein n=1 Tax=Clostridioides difficile TaxID=1496 RepID=UPI0000DA5641|nr:putative phage protein [Peptoclostridium phage p630P1] [Clostridioides difficile 630]AJP12664.1 putative phage protein [Peptoclostridium phage p630P2] [Clostridioides difficile 630]ARE61861.1 putative phage protein [Peptoclostridium phage p630P1] [Clostridioides difficile]ARE63843.1 putative phage protein [Peptoclostridium phage p630P2] [Clostridioides difficile]CCL67678.1 Putative phage protein [Clostridioides difficile T3]
MIILNKTLSKEDNYKFTKEQIVNSKKYVNRKDLLNAILKENDLYSFSEVEEIINSFMKGVS